MKTPLTRTLRFTWYTAVRKPNIYNCMRNTKLCTRKITFLKLPGKVGEGRISSCPRSSSSDRSRAGRFIARPCLFAEHYTTVFVLILAIFLLFHPTIYCYCLQHFKSSQALGKIFKCIKRFLSGQEPVMSHVYMTGKFSRWSKNSWLKRSLTCNSNHAMFAYSYKVRYLNKATRVSTYLVFTFYNTRVSNPWSNTRQRLLGAVPLWLHLYSICFSF